MVKLLNEEDKLHMMTYGLFQDFKEDDDSVAEEEVEEKVYLKFSTKRKHRISNEEEIGPKRKRRKEFQNQEITSSEIKNTGTEHKVNKKRNRTIYHLTQTGKVEILQPWDIFKQMKIAKKECRRDLNYNSFSFMETSEGLHSESRDEPSNARQSKQDTPHNLFELMYRIDLSVLCSLRKSMHKCKYSSLSLSFGNSENVKFNHIVLRREHKSTHIQIEYSNEYYADYDINYGSLFRKQKQSFYVNNYFDSFVKNQVSNSEDSSLSNIEYLIVYTHSGIDCTDGMELRKKNLKNFYPFKFDKIDIDKCDILKDFLFTSDKTARGRAFYKFSRDETTREELFKRLEFSSEAQKVMEEREFSQKKVKRKFLDKLVFAVKQPDRQELRTIIKNEIKDGQVQKNYTALREKMIRKLAARGEFGCAVTYELNLLMSLLHDMFLDKNMFSINSDAESRDGIFINYKNRITYMKVHYADRSIDYNQLFPGRNYKKQAFSINKYFSHFIEELNKSDIRYFIVYTNADLYLTEGNRLRMHRQTRNFHPLKFDSIDIRKKKYKILRNCSCINTNGLYRFSEDEKTKILGLLRPPPSLHEEKEMKEKFLHKLIFAVNQPGNGELISINKNAIDKSHEVSYVHEELQEVALRFLESHEFDPITEKKMKEIFEDVRYNRLSAQRIQNKNIDEEIKFIAGTHIRKSSLMYKRLLQFLINGDGAKYLEVLKRERINLSNVSSILNGAGMVITKAFADLYNLWFDENGKKTKYLTTLEKEKIKLSSMSCILKQAGIHAARGYKELYDLWFDTEGNKTRYLTSLEEKGINLKNITSILSRSKSDAAKAYKDLYNLWFDTEGNKTRYLKTLEENEMSLARISSILSGSNVNSAKSFKDLYDLWFDAEGNKRYLKALEEERIDLIHVSSILSGTGTNASITFKDLYHLWFDEHGKKTQCLKTLQDNGVNLSQMSCFLSGAGPKAPKAFKQLYDLWFNAEGNKTVFLKTFENEVNLSCVSIMLIGAGANTVRTFRELYNLWFDAKGNKTQYLKTLEDHRINLSSISLLHKTGTKLPETFKDLYDLWFDAKGNKTKYLKTLDNHEVNLASMTRILSLARSNAVKAYKDLYDLWFDTEGNKTRYLRILDEHRINLADLCRIFNKTGNKAAKSFKELIDLWFDAAGNKTKYLKTLEKEEISISYACEAIKRTRTNAAKAYKDLYNLWFDAEGNKTQYLIALKERGMKEFKNPTAFLDEQNTIEKKKQNEF